MSNKTHIVMNKEVKGVVKSIREYSNPPSSFHVEVGSHIKVSWDMKTPLKFHTTTNLPNYGCEVFDVEKLPKFGKKFIKRKGIKPILVNRRERGLTSSGSSGECHGNVALLVR